MKRLAVITICLNDRAGLERTAASVFGQTTRAFDYIVVDGASNDGSIGFIQANEGRIDRWISGKDDGIYDAMNKGWRLASTEFVLFLNAGDAFAAPDALEQALGRLDPGTDIAYGDIQLSDDRGVYRTKRYPASITSAWLMKEAVPHPAQFIRRSLLERCGGYDLQYRIAADYAFFCRLFWKEHARVQRLDLVVSTFDTRGMSSNAAGKAQLRQERKAIQRRFAPRPWYIIYQGYAAFNRLIGR